MWFIPDCFSWKLFTKSLKIGKAWGGAIDTVHGTLDRDERICVLVVYLFLGVWKQIEFFYAN